jgi:serpin B
MGRILLIILSISAILLTACAPQLPPITGEEIKSDKHRIESPVVSESALTTLTEGNTDFALNLYRQLKDDDGNIFFSPFSVSMALAMVYAGARGATETEMADTMHFGLPQSELHPAFNKLDSELNSRGEGAQGKDDKGFRLNIVNAIWGQEGFDFLQGFLDTLAENYGAGMRLLDFIANPEQCRQIINKWVSDQTEDRIKDLIPEGLIDKNTRLVLTNAIYFNAAWLNQFEEGATREGDFHLLNGSTASVDMMHQTEHMGYTSGDGYEAVELPYDGDELSMIIMVPDEGQFEQFEDTINAGFLNTVIHGIADRNVSLALPKYEFESEFNLNDAMKSMGMSEAFSQSADFSGMTGKRDLYISDIVHKAFVSVDENGTEAAAATAVIMRLTAAPGGETITVTIDRPFIFLIRDIPTDTILFMGRVVNPQS